MDKVIVTAMLTVAALTAAIMVVNAVLPAVSRSSGALISSSGQASERIKTDLDIIHVVGDSSGNLVYVWLKNVGGVNILAISNSDMFLKTPTANDRLPHGSGTEYWDYVIEGGDTLWKPTVTVKATLHLTSLAAGDYKVTFITINGTVAEKEFTI